MFKVIAATQAFTQLQLALQLQTLHRWLSLRINRLAVLAAFNLITLPLVGISRQLQGVAGLARTILRLHRHFQDLTNVLLHQLARRHLTRRGHRLNRRGLALHSPAVLRLVAAVAVIVFKVIAATQAFTQLQLALQLQTLHRWLSLRINRLAVLAAFNLITLPLVGISRQLQGVAGLARTILRLHRHFQDLTNVLLHQLARRHLTRRGHRLNRRGLALHSPAVLRLVAAVAVIVFKVIAATQAFT